MSAAASGGVTTLLDMPLNCVPETTDVAALEAKLRTQKIAAFIVEPVQSEAGIRVPAAGYLEAAQVAC